MKRRIAKMPLSLPQAAKPFITGFCTGMAVVGLLYGLIYALSTFFVLNGSWSAPHWGYARLPIAAYSLFRAEPHFAHGDWIEFTPRRGAPWPYIKQIYGLPGDSVTVTDARLVRINGKPVGIAKPYSQDGRPLIPISSQNIPAGQVFVATDHPDGHDSRYAEIGLVPITAIRARVWPLPDIPFLGLDEPVLMTDTQNPHTQLIKGQGSED